MEKDHLINELKKHGKTIGEQGGEELADKVMKSYMMWSRCPGDEMAFVMCEKAYEKWLEANRDLVEV